MSDIRERFWTSRVSPSERLKSRPRASRAGEKPYTCGGCDTRWSGGGRAHCSGCHRTFNTTNLFERHRRLRGEVGTCLDPATLTTKSDDPVMIENDGIWRAPADPNFVFGGAR